MTFEEAKNQRLKNYKLYSDYIKSDLSFFEKVLDEKCLEKSEELIKMMLKDYAYGMKKTIIDFNDIELFPKKTKFDTVEYQRTIVLPEGRINYSLTYLNGEWLVTAENLKIPYPVNMFGRLTIIFENQLTKTFGDLDLKVNGKVYSIYY